MKKNQWLLLIILILVAANAYLLWHVYQNAPSEQPVISRNERLKAWMKKDLGFSDKQAEDYIQIRNLRDSLLKPANLELRQAKMGIISLLRDSAATDSSTQSVITNIGNKQEAVELVYLAHFRRLNALCTPEQRPSLDSLIERMIKRNTGGGVPDSTNQKN